MPEADCCSFAVSCVAPLRAAQAFRPFGEECFCVDGDGLAQGPGVFRVRSVDLHLVYTDGVRAPLPFEQPIALLNSDWAFGAVVLAVMLVSLAGRSAGLRALGSLTLAALSMAAAFPVGAAVTGVIGLIAGAGYGLGGMVVLGGSVAAFVSWVVAAVVLVRRGAASAKWTFGLGALAVALVVAVLAARAWNPVWARAVLRLAPAHVSAPASQG
ncbi:MAG: hypothetical protein MUC96_34695 [Myxococcaceae bacterium]|jgi:hypothetical protein|nr:hypothetical protein [Myxococcaceae bacterium]